MYNHKNLQNAASVLNSELEKVSSWCKVNKLSLNISKTHFVIFHPFYKSINDIDIFIGNTQIKRVDVIKFLGLYIDPVLKWSSHISKIKTSISKVIGILYKIRDFVPNYILKNLYNTLIYPHLSYCNIVWGNAHPSNVNQLFLQQKKIVRIITHSNILAHTPPLFSMLNILNIFDIHRHQCAVFIFKFINKQLPDNFKNFFILSQSIHSHNTRSSQHLFSVSINCDLFKRSIVCCGVNFWNSLSNSIRNIKSLNSFSSELINHLMSKYNHM